MTPEHETWIDLLVDGELDDARRRRLLLALEAAPQGWRRCALAFLEAQSMREALAESAFEAAVAAGTIRAVGVPEPRRQSWRRLPSALALAASVALAFAAGLWWRGTDAPGVAPDPGASAISEPSPTFAKPSQALPPETADAPPGPARLVSLELADGQGQRRHAVQLPVYDAALDSAQWLAQADAAGPAPEVLAELERRGHEVRERRQLVPVRLTDGQELIVPVKEIELRLNAAPVYQ
jgi:hypothetical protein